MLIIQYLTHFNFGIPYALNVFLAVNENNSSNRQVIYLGNSILIVIYQAVFILFLLIASFAVRIDIFDKFAFYNYIYLVCFIAIVQNFNSLFINLYRVKDSLKAIIFYQILMPLGVLFACVFFKGRELLYALLVAYLASYTIAAAVFVIYSPVSIRFRWRAAIQKEIFKKGLALLLYNASFYFIMITTRSFVSYFFKVKELGYFSFSLSVAQASFLALDTISFLIFPKLINRFRYKSGSKLFESVDFVRTNYSMVSYLLIFISILAFPIILILLPEYYASFKPFVLLSISMAILSGSFGISTLFISFGKEFLLGKIALITLIINCIIVWFIASATSLFYMVCFAPIVTYFIYCFLLNYFYYKEFARSGNVILASFDLRLLGPSILLVIGVMLNSFIVQLIAYLLILLLNFNNLKTVYSIVRTIIRNPSLFKI